MTAHSDGTDAGDASPHGVWDGSRNLPSHPALNDGTDNA